MADLAKTPVRPWPSRDMAMKSRSFGEEGSSSSYRGGFGGVTVGVHVCLGVENSSWCEYCGLRPERCGRAARTEAGGLGVGAGHSRALTACIALCFLGVITGGVGGHSRCMTGLKRRVCIFRLTGAGGSSAEAEGRGLRGGVSTRCIVFVRG
jgi:hypothetical protein